MSLDHCDGEEMTASRSSIEGGVVDNRIDPTQTIEILIHNLNSQNAKHCHQRETNVAVEELLTPYLYPNIYILI